MLVYETGPFPFILASCFDEGDFQNTMQRFELSRAFLDGHDVSACHFMREGEKLLALMCFDFPKGANLAFVAGYIALELNRAIKELWAYIGEDHPGTEIEGQFFKNYMISIMAHWMEKNDVVVQ
jgi:hypothetical protein